MNTFDPFSDLFDDFDIPTRPPLLDAETYLAEMATLTEQELKEKKVDAAVANLLLNWISEHPDWIKTHANFAQRIFKVFTRKDSSLSDDNLKIAYILYKQHFSTLGMDDLKQLMSKCLLSSNRKTGLALIEDFINRSTAEEAKELLHDPIFFSNLVNAHKELKFGIIKKILEKSSQIVTELILTESCKISLEDSFIYDWLNNKNLMQLLASHENTQSALCDLIAHHPDIVNFSILKNLEYLIDRWSLQKMKPFLLKENEGSQSNLFKCLENPNIREKLLQKNDEISDLKELLKERKVVEYYLNLLPDLDYKELLESLLRIQLDLSAIDPNLLLRLYSFIPSFESHYVSFADHLNYLSSEQIDNHLQKEWETIPNAQKTIMLKTLLDRQAEISSENFLRIIQNNETRLFLQENGPKQLDKWLKQPSLVISYFESIQIYANKELLQNFFNSLSHDNQLTLLKTLAERFFPQSPIDVKKDADLLAQLRTHLLTTNYLSELLSVLKGQVPLIDYLSVRSEWTQPAIIDFTTKALANAQPFTINAIRMCLYMHNTNVLKQILQNVDPHLIHQHSNDLINDLAKTEDLQLAEALLAKGLNKQAVLENSLLNELVKNNDWQIVKYLFEKGLKIENSQEGEKLIQDALESGNLELVELIWNSIKGLLLLTISYPEIIGLSQQENQQRIKKLNTYAMCTSLPILYAFIEQYYPELKPELKNTLKLLSLLVRFPSASDRKEVSDQFNILDQYAENSLQYARENLDFIESSKHTDSWDAFLTEIIENRFNRVPTLSQNYRTLRTSESLYRHQTPMSKRAVNDFNANAIQKNRYFHAWNQAAKFNRERGQLKETSSLTINNNEVCFTHPSLSDPITKLKIDTDSIIDSVLVSSVSRITWDHASFLTVRQSLTHVNELHKQIMQFELKEDNQDEFYELVAEAYWFIATLCETARGTPHNAMIWLNQVYHHHHLPPPIPKLEHFFLDNTMLVLPVEEAKARWRTFFEPIPDEFK